MAARKESCTVSHFSEHDIVDVRCISQDGDAEVARICSGGSSSLATSTSSSVHGTNSEEKEEESHDADMLRVATASVKTVRGVRSVTLEGDQQQEETQQQHNIAMMLVGQQQKHENDQQRKGDLETDAVASLNEEQNDDCNLNTQISDIDSTITSMKSATAQKMQSNEEAQNFFSPTSFTASTSRYPSLSQFPNEPSSSYRKNSPQEPSQSVLTATTENSENESIESRNIYDDLFGFITNEANELQNEHAETVKKAESPPFLPAFSQKRSECEKEMKTDDELPEPLSFSHVLSPQPTWYEIEHQPFQKEWSLFDEIDELQNMQSDNVEEKHSNMSHCSDSDQIKIFSEEQRFLCNDYDRCEEWILERGTSNSATTAAPEQSNPPQISVASGVVATMSTSPLIENVETGYESYRVSDPFMGRDESSISSPLLFTSWIG